MKSLSSLLRSKYWDARKNARIRNIEFTLTETDFVTLCKKANGRCAVTGIKFSDKRLPNISRRPYIPSIDRIDSTKGYNKKNVRLVLSSVNIAMNEWGEKVLYKIAEGIFNNRKKLKIQLLEAREMYKKEKLEELLQEEYSESKVEVILGLKIGILKKYRLSKNSSLLNIAKISYKGKTTIHKYLLKELISFLNTEKILYNFRCFYPEHLILL